MPSNSASLHSHPMLNRFLASSLNIHKIAIEVALDLADFLRPQPEKQALNKVRLNPTPERTLLNDGDVG